MTTYRVTLQDGTVLDIEADSVEMTNEAGQSVALDAASYDEVDLEAASLGLGDAE